VKYCVRYGDREHWVELIAEGAAWRVIVDGEESRLDAAEVAPGAYSILTDGRSREVAVSREGDRFTVRLGGAAY
jgi:hypothetical protein